MNRQDWGIPAKQNGIVRVYVGSGDGAIASLPEKFEAELNLAGGCRSTGDRASGSGKAGRVS